MSVKEQLTRLLKGDKIPNYTQQVLGDFQKTPAHSAFAAARAVLNPEAAAANVAFKVGSSPAFQRQASNAINRLGNMQVPALSTLLPNNPLSSFIPQQFQPKITPFQAGNFVKSMTIEPTSRVGGSLGLTLQGREAAIPKAGMQQFLFGKQPVKSFPAQKRDYSTFLQQKAGFSPQQADLSGSLALAGVTALDVSPLGFGKGKSLVDPRRVAMLRRVLRPEDIRIIGRFAELVESGKDRKALGELGTIVQSLTENVFGSKARNLTNKQIKNIWDLHLSAVGQQRNGAGLGLAVKDVRDTALAKQAALDKSNVVAQATGGVKPLQPLAQEARKYKSAEEFVDSNIPVFRGGEAVRVTERGDRGLPVSTDRKVAETFLKAKQDFRKSLPFLEKPSVSLEEGFISKSAKIATRKDIPDDIYISYRAADPLLKPDVAEPIIGKWAKANGFDAVDYRTLGKTSAKEAEIKVLNPDVLKTKQQLTDIYTQATGGVKAVEEASGVSLKTPILDNKPLTISQVAPDNQGQLPNPLDTEASRSTMNQPISNSSTEQYIKELTQKQQQARSTGNVGIKQKVGSLLADFKAKLVDETSPITDILTVAEKQNKFKTRPSQDIRLQIDRVLRSKSLASQFAEDNGLVNVIKNAPDMDALDQYMIAKQAASVEKQGIKTGRDLVRDQQLVNDLAPQYEAHAKVVNEYSRKLLKYSVETGLIDENLATELVKKYPVYVPLNRIFNQLEKSVNRGTGKGIASISKQTVVQRLKGSEREITSPVESLLLKTQDAFSQGERNVAAKQLASYRTLPGFEGLIKEVDAGGRAPHTFSFIENGVKKTFATTPEISAAAKSLNIEQMGLLGKILSTPTRMLQLGATGLNIPFVVTNMLKDEVSGFVNSSRAAKTSILNPTNFVKALFAAIKHDELYKDLVRNAGGGTSFDIARDAPNLAIARLRNPVGFTVRHPLELLRAIENVVGRSEELGRIKNFEGMRQALLKEGRTLQDANLLAAQAARENTANFARRGSFGRVINWTIPFFNAGIQGSRQLVRSFQNAPAQTSAKVAITIFTPIAVSTAWNLSDPQRKQIYQDIPQYEKENNIILIPPEPTQDAKGRWNVIKIPLPPGLSNLGTIVRRQMESAEGLDPVRFSELATNLITAGTSVDITSGNKLASTFTPQIAKPIVEATTNTNLFTGRRIIPDYMKNKLPEAQTRSGVSGVATGIGKMLNVSPLMVENFAQTQLGGLGSQLLGKENPVSNLERRFGKASGGVLLDKVYSDSAQVQAVESQVRDLAEAGRREDAIQLIRQNKDLLRRANTIKTIKSQVDTYQKYKKRVRDDTRLTQEQKNKVLILIENKLNGLSNAYNEQK